MSSPDLVNPIKSNPREEALTAGKTRPDNTPRTNKNFKRLVEKESGAPDKEEQEAAAVEEKSEKQSAPSLFDLSKASKSKASLLQESLFSQELAEEKTETAVKGKESSSGFGKNIPEGINVKRQEINSAISKNLEEREEIIDDISSNQDLADSLITREQDTETGTKLALAEKLVRDSSIQGELANSSIQEEVAKQGAAASNGVKKGRLDTLSHDTDATVLALKKDKGKLTTKENSRSEFFQENADLTAIKSQLPQQSIGLAQEKASLMEDEQMTRSVVKDIVAQVAERIQTVQTEGKTDTIVTLRYPPILEGATVTLTAYDGIKNEYKVAFHNLSLEGKVFIDRKLVEDSLSAHLADKGIILSSLTTSTQPSENEQNFARDQQEQQGQKGQQGRQQQTFADADEEDWI